MKGRRGRIGYVPAIQREKKDTVMRYVLLWALGVPISGLIVLHLLGVI
jgi:hypothetical protein